MRVSRDGDERAHRFGQRPLLGLALLSAATLAYEIALPRLYAVSQFYHFAFLIISLAMLGFGAGGTWLALAPGCGRRNPSRWLAALSLIYALTSAGAYLLMNSVPFDSFSVAWDAAQLLVLALHYVVMALPFFCSGAVLNLLFMHHQRAIRHIYAVNLLGSAVGCLAGWALPAWVGGEGIIWVSGALGALAGLCFLQPKPRTDRCRRWPGWLLFAGVTIACSLLAISRPAPLALRLSPYKGLSYALQVPESQVLSTDWSAYARVDLVQSPAIRSLPGLSYRYLGPVPAQRGAFVDGDDLSAVITLPPSALEEDEGDRLAFLDYLPSVVAYRLRPSARVLVLEPRGGLELWTALSQGAVEVTAVEPNPLLQDASLIYTHDRVQTVSESPRSFLRRTPALYDVIVQPLTSPYRSVRSGAYSLAEDYTLTVEAFRDALGRLSPDGLFVVTRWLQTPPSESLRTFALAIEAVERAGGAPARQIVAFRGYATMTFLISARPFTAEELTVIRRLAAERAFDMTYAPDIVAGETNRYNVLQTSAYYELFTGLLAAPDRTAWFRAYVFSVAPPTDDRPFFGHFFKWAQAGQMLAELGKSWQPFGGAGYLIVVALLALASVLAFGLIILPVAVVGRSAARARAFEGRTLSYFALVGLGYLFVEIPLIQRFILYLGHPTYALTAVLAALLLCSGLGSALSGRYSLRVSLVALVAVTALLIGFLQPLFESTLSLPLAGRLLVALLALAPLGFLMGMPFPQGIQRLAQHDPRRIPWAWAVNAAASVVASVSAALLALSVGFRWVLVLGATCYALAWLVGSQGSGTASGSDTPAPVNGTNDTPPRL